MAAPDLTQRVTVFVQKVGTDDAGANAVGAPQSRLTIAAALADLAANYPAASATFFHIVAVGPGTFAEAGLVLPPWTFVNGSCDGEDQPTTVVSLSDDVTLSAGWSVNATARGGIGNLTLTAASGTPVVDLTFPVPAAGNPARTVQIFNVQTALSDLVFEATSTADAVQYQRLTQNGTSAHTIRQIGGTSTLANINTAAALSIVDKTGFPTIGAWTGVVMGASSTLTASSIAAAGCTLRLTASAPRAVVFNQTAPGSLAVSADAVSLPVRASVSYTGTATAAANLAFLSDAAGEGYTPTTPANWSPVPTTVQGALDTLAAGGGGGPGTFSKITRTGNLSSAAWGLTGAAIASIANTFTNTTSAGVVASAVAVSFGVPTLAASSVTTYTNAANVYISGDPVAGSNVTISNAWGLWNAGKTRLDGNVTATNIAGPTTTDLTLVGGSNGASLVLGQGANGLLTLGVNSIGDVAKIQNSNVSGYSSVSYFDNTGTQKALVGYGNASVANPIFVSRFVIWANTGNDIALAPGGVLYGLLKATGNFLWGTTVDMVGTGGVKIAGTTSSTSTTSGSLINAGGFGNAGSVFVGGTVRANGGFIGSAGGVGITQASTPTLGRSITVENGLITAFA